MARKSEGKESKLSYSGNLLVENQNGLIVNAEMFVANGTAERDAALVMLERIPGGKQVTVGGDNWDGVAEALLTGARRITLGLQAAVPLVCRLERGCRSLGCDDVQHLFHEQSHTPDRIQHLQQLCPQQLLRRNRRPANLGIHCVEPSRQTAQHLIHHLPDGAQRISHHVLS